MCSALPLDLAEDRVERVLERPVDRIALRGPQLVEILVDPLARLGPGLAVAALQVAHDFVAREHGARDLVGHVGHSVAMARCLSALCVRLPAALARR